MYWRCVRAFILYLIDEISFSFLLPPIITAALGSPLFLVKARIQAYSPALPVGAQHKYRGSWDALTTILRSDGVFGLWRGVNAALLRTAMVRTAFPPKGISNR